MLKQITQINKNLFISIVIFKNGENRDSEAQEDHWKTWSRVSHYNFRITSKDSI